LYNIAVPPLRKLSTIAMVVLAKGHFVVHQ